MDEERYQEAISYLQEATRRTPSFGEAYLELGICHLKLKRFEEAKQTLILAKNLLKDKSLKQRAVEILEKIPEEMERERIREEEEKSVKEKVTPQISLPLESKEPAKSGESLTGRLVKMEGLVNFREKAKENWRPAVRQMKLSAGNWLQTGEDSKAIVAFGREAVLTADQNVVLEIKEVAQETDGTIQVKTEITNGKVWSLVERLKTERSRYEVETPTAVAGVRGTAFMVKFDPETQSSRIAVAEGEVGVQSLGEKPAYVILKEKMATTVIYNQKPMPPSVIEAAEIAEWENWKQMIPFSELGVIGGMAEMHAMQLQEATRLVRETGARLKGGKKAFEDFKVFQAALQQYYRDTGDFPAREVGLEALLKNPGVKNWNGPYVDPSSNLLDPFGRPYQYRLKKTQKGLQYVEIRSPGFDGITGSEDDEVTAVFPERGTSR